MWRKSAFSDRERRWSGSRSRPALTVPLLLPLRPWPLSVIHSPVPGALCLLPPRATRHAGLGLPGPQPSRPLARVSGSLLLDHPRHSEAGHRHAAVSVSVSCLCSPPGTEAETTGSTRPGPATAPGAEGPSAGICRDNRSRN